MRIAQIFYQIERRRAHARDTTPGAQCCPIVTIRNRLPCVSAFTADDQASHTNGFGPVHSTLDTIWTRCLAGGRVFSARGAMGGVARRRIWRKDFTNLCQKSWDALQAAGGAL